ncbi:MAG: pitrilysin family protein [Bacteroidales bacterium]|nr:pitrilysin family protein [Bacteroidales bacterium]
MTTLDRTKAPAVRPLSDISLVPPVVTSLANGITLTTVRAGDQPLVRLVVMSEGGRYDFSPISAIALMGEAMREGAGGMTGEQIADIIDYSGARLGSRVSDHHNGIDLIVLNSRLADLLPVVRAMIETPDFDERPVDIIRRRQSSNRAVQLTKVGVRATTLSKQMIAGKDHIAGSLDTPEQILAVTADDLRRCHRQTFGSAQLHVYMAGNYDDVLLRSVTEMFESLPARTGKSPVTVTPYVPEPARRINDPRPDAQQSAVSMTLPAIPRTHPDYIALRLTLMGLGGYFGSRLMSNIREDKGLTYGIGASLQGSFEGAFASIDAQCDASYVDQVIAESMAEVRSLVDNPIDGEELNRLKLKAWSTLASTADSPMSMIDYHITGLVVGTPADYFEQQLRAIDGLTADTVSRMASTYLLADSWRIAVSGPF